jgi:D-glycero-D-manno-heptose 1,7-bisphosphate phosphatase
MRFSIHTPRADQATPAIFLDRDGTINVERNYLHRIEDWEWIPGAKEAIRKFKRSGYRVVIVSNQSGIARGMYAPSDVEHLHTFVQQELVSLETVIDAFYYCPHHPDFSGNCSCRKPAPGMLVQASLDLNLDLAQSWMIGDKLIDVQAGSAAGVPSMMVRTGYGVGEQEHIGLKTLVFDSVLHVAEFIVTNEQCQGAA